MTLALASNQRSLLTAASCIGHRLQCATQQIEARRWRYIRKPIYLPTGPTKLFVIKQKPPMLPNEERTRVTLDNIWATRMASITQYFYKEFYEPTTFLKGFSAEQVEAEIEEHKKLLEENESFNKEVAAKRQQRYVEGSLGL